MNKDQRREYIREHYSNTPNSTLAQHLNITPKAVQKVAQRLGIKKDPTCGKIKEEHTPKEGEMEKQTIEVRHDGLVVINWATKTIVTQLGEFGSVLTSFSTHGAIQRYYVDGYGEKHTASETATKFTIFPHAKAVYIYARLHGFSKASLGQSDIEFEEGLTEDEAVQENLQSLKARVARKTELEKWKLVQQKADSWDKFFHEKYLPMKDWIEESLPKFKPTKFQPLTVKQDVAWVIGFNDWHYRKFCYDYQGKTTYDRKIALKVLSEGTLSIITKGLKFGTPEKIFVTMGGDNLTTDNSNETTTGGTSQIGQVEGIHHIDMAKYIDTTVNTYEILSQISQLTIVPTLGNHDRESSRMLYIFLRHLYKNRPDIQVAENYLSRTYLKYGNNGMGFAHGDDMSLAKWKRNAHKLFLVEAREQKVNLNTARNLYLFLQHLHTDMYEDLGGIRQYVLPAPPPPDDWHAGKGYVGNYTGMSLHILDKKAGIQGVLYS
jgi:hypothetical protein